MSLPFLVIPRRCLTALPLILMIPAISAQAAAVYVTGGNGANGSVGVSGQDGFADNPGNGEYQE